MRLRKKIAAFKIVIINSPGTRLARPMHSPMACIRQNTRTLLQPLNVRLHILHQSVGSARLLLRHARAGKIVRTVPSNPWPRCDGTFGRWPVPFFWQSAVVHPRMCGYHAKRFLKNEQARQLSPIAGSGNERVHRGSIRYFSVYVFRAQRPSIQSPRVVVSYESRHHIATQSKISRGEVQKFHCSV